MLPNAQKNVCEEEQNTQRSPVSSPDLLPFDFQIFVQLSLRCPVACKLEPPPSSLESWGRNLNLEIRMLQWMGGGLFGGIGGF